MQSLRRFSDQLMFMAALVFKVAAKLQEVEVARGWRRAHVEKEAMDAGGSERWAVGGSQHARAQVAGRTVPLN